MDYIYTLTDEYEKKKELIIEMEERIASLPKGNLQPKKIRGLIYYYLQFREGGKVKTKYIPEKDRSELDSKIAERKSLEAQLKVIYKDGERLGQMLGKHINYKPVKKIDMDEYTLFMSAVAHDYKRMTRDSFLKKYKPSKFRGVQKKYLKGFTDWMKGSYEIRIHKGNDLILDPYTYHMYFDAGEKRVLDEELKSAIPEFLNQGLLITDIQEAVHDA